MNILKRILYRFRSAITGRWITKAEAERNPDTTIRERLP